MRFRLYNFEPGKGLWRPNGEGYCGENLTYSGLYSAEHCASMVSQHIPVGGLVILPEDPGTAQIYLNLHLEARETHA